MQNYDTQKVLSVVCHASIFLSSTLISLGIPIVILLVSDDFIIKDNAREAINFHINLYFYGIIAGVLAATIIGIPIAIIIGIALLICSFLLPIVAIVKTIERVDRPYKYPFILRLL